MERIFKNSFPRACNKTRVKEGTSPPAHRALCSRESRAICLLISVMHVQERGPAILQRCHFNCEKGLSRRNSPTVDFLFHESSLSNFHESFKVEARSVLQVPELVNYNPLNKTTGNQCHIALFLPQSAQEMPCPLSYRTLGRF